MVSSMENWLANHNQRANTAQENFDGIGCPIRRCNLFCANILELIFDSTNDPVCFASCLRTCSWRRSTSDHCHLTWPPCTTVTIWAMLFVVYSYHLTAINFDGIRRNFCYHREESQTIFCHTRSSQFFHRSNSVPHQIQHQR